MEDARYARPLQRRGCQPTGGCAGERRQVRYEPDARGELVYMIQFEMAR